MTPPSDLERKALAISRRLDECGIPHAVGGALAYTFHGVPRQTTDIDFNIYLSDAAGEQAVDCLAELGVKTIGEGAIGRLQTEGQTRLDWGGTYVDLFFAYHAFHDSCRARTREVPFAGGRIPILSAEDLVVFKVIFNRNRDWGDIDSILGVRGPGFDLPYVRRWLEEILGADDSRIARLRGVAEDAE